MRTGRSLTVFWSLLFPGGGWGMGLVQGGLILGGLAPGGVWSWGGCLVPGVSGLRGGACLDWGCLVQGVWPWGVSGPRGCLVLGGVWSQGCLDCGWLCWSGTIPVNRMTNRCKNITLAKTSFWLVTISASTNTGLNLCHVPLKVYRSGTINSKSFVGKNLLRIKWKFKLTVHFKHEMLGKITGKYFIETSNKMELRINHVRINRSQPVFILKKAYRHRF